MVVLVDLLHELGDAGRFAPGFLTGHAWISIRVSEVIQEGWADRDHFLRRAGTAVVVHAARRHVQTHAAGQVLAEPVITADEEVHVTRPGRGPDSERSSRRGAREEPEVQRQE